MEQKPGQEQKKEDSKIQGMEITFFRAILNKTKKGQDKKLRFLLTFDPWYWYCCPMHCNYKVNFH
jgi:hypothetical protein